MSELEGFLSQDIEGYLFGDLNALQSTGVGFPLLMSAFSGIELFGALTSVEPFDTNRGESYFTKYWVEFLYPHAPESSTIAKVVYQLFRHGIAHCYVLKGKLAIVRNDPARHLRRDATGTIYVDAGKLADDLGVSFKEHVRKYATRKSPAPNTSSMSKRLDEIRSKYAAQAEGLAPRFNVFPETTATSASISCSFRPWETPKQ